MTAIAHQNPNITLPREMNNLRPVYVLIQDLVPTCALECRVRSHLIVILGENNEVPAMHPPTLERIGEVIEVFDLRPFAAYF